MWRPIIQWRGRYVASYNPVERTVCGVLLSSREEGMWRPMISREEGMWRPIIKWRGRYMASYNPIERKVCDVL